MMKSLEVVNGQIYQGDIYAFSNVQRKLGVHKLFVGYFKSSFLRIKFGDIMI